MAKNITSRFKKAWNVFFNKDPTLDNTYTYSVGNYYRPDRNRLSCGNEKTIINSIYTRIALDVSSTEIKHVRTDSDGKFIEEINSGLNYCLNVESNIDQTGNAFIMDLVMSMLDEGVVAAVPTVYYTDDNPSSNSIIIEKMRIGQITEWHPYFVKVSLYNEDTGQKEEVKVLKSRVAIIENPFYSVMNEPNSTLKRLTRKLNLLDTIDEQSGSGKLDIIIQLPYTVRSQLKKDLAEERRKAIEDQLAGSKYGIAYIDSTEHITQLNRPAENNLLTQIEYLTKNLYAQLGITNEILDGTANEQTMQNYIKRTIEPIINAITEEFERKFLTKTARSQHQAIMAFTNMFRIIPLNQLADIADKFTRNEILTSNEIRQIIGFKPSSEPNANELRNKNLPQEENQNGMENAINIEESKEWFPKDEYESAIKNIDGFDSQLNELSKQLNNGELKHYASKYYDPVKAHEYYERTKELKGKNASTSSLNDEGKAAVKMVKESIAQDKKQDIADAVSKYSNKIKKLRDENNAKIKQFSKSMSNDIERIKENIKKYGNSNPRIKAEANNKIAKLKEQNVIERARLKEEYKNSANNLKLSKAESISKIKTDYDNQYQTELNAIKSNSAYAKTTTKKATTKKETSNLANASLEERKVAARKKLKEYFNNK